MVGRQGVLRLTLIFIFANFKIISLIYNKFEQKIRKINLIINYFTNNYLFPKDLLL